MKIARNYYQIFLWIGFIFGACDKGGGTNYEICNANEIYIEGRCVPLMPDAGIDGGGPDSAENLDTGGSYTPIDINYPTEFIPCNTVDVPNCWACYQDSMGVYCLQEYPVFPCDLFTDWNCRDTEEGSRICERTGSISECTITGWTCDAQGSITQCTQDKTDYPDPETLAWICYEDDSGRHCSYPFCHYGRLAGYLCDPESGNLLTGVRVSLNIPSPCVPSGKIETVTDMNGWFALEDVLIGTHPVYIEEQPSNISIRIIEGQTTEYPSLEQCVCQYGTVKGKVCNVRDKHWSVLANISFDVPEGCGLEAYTVTKRTDIGGNVEFIRVPVGEYSLTVSEGNYTCTAAVKVEANTVAEIGKGENRYHCTLNEQSTYNGGNEACECNYGSLAGRICVDTIWVSGGTIEYNMPGDRCGFSGEAEVSEISSDGYFSINNIPDGQYALNINGEAFNVEVIANQTIGFSGDNSCACPTDGCVSEPVTNTFEGSQLKCEHIWVANYTHNTISRIDVNTGSYKIYNAYGTNPSRTAVDQNCDVWVANRQAGTNNFIKLNHNCEPDGSGLGCDLCKIKVDGNFDAFRGLAVDKDNNVWAGASDVKSGELWIFHYDSQTCAEISRHSFEAYSDSSRIPNYGFALFNDNGNEVLWISQYPNHITRCDLQNPAAPDCKTESITTNCYGIYAIAVDRNGNAWLALWGSGGGACKVSYNKLTGAFTATKTAAPTSPLYSSGNTGIVIYKDKNQGDGSKDIVFTASNSGGGSGVISAYTLDGNMFRLTTGTGGNIHARGIGIDTNLNLWSVGTDGYCSKTTFNYDSRTFGSTSLLYSGKNTAYTYSDFAGYSLFNYAMDAHINYKFDAGAGEGFDYKWLKINWNLSTAPSGTVTLKFKFRSASTLTELAATPWINYQSIVTATASSFSGQLDLITPVNYYGEPYYLSKKRYFEVDVVGYSNDTAIGNLSLTLKTTWQKCVPGGC